MRYLVVGYGNIGAKRKAALGARCVATVDPFNAAADLRDVRDCDPARYDVAILATPNSVKLELLEQFLGLGKSVLVEKPLVFAEPQTAVRLEALGRRHRAIWYTSYNFRFEPNVVALKTLLDTGAIGAVYRAHLFYGNGTAGSIAGTWRDTPLAILEDMASHLVDLAGFVFGRFGSPFLVWERRAHELKGPDHCVLATPDRSLVIESSFLAWKNRWHITVVGHDGSIEMDGLTKWGASELIVRRRQFPSGPPQERRHVVHGPDATWDADLRHFEECVADGRSSCDNDLWLSRTILAAADAPLEATAP
jgi:scyllo-inositol 2-dehydrogenase (NADP+)